MREKINIFVKKMESDGSLQTGFVFSYKFGDIVKVLDIILFIPFGAIFFLLD